MVARVPRLAVAATLTVAATTIASQQAKAEMTVRDGVIVRSELKGGGMPFGLSIEGLTLGRGTTTHVCNPSPVCETRLFVFPGGYKIEDRKFVWDPLGCTVYWPYKTIKVTRRQQPVVRWILTKFPVDPSKYFFDPTIGIRLVPDPNKPHEQNDQRYDLTKPFVDQDGIAFNWISLNKNPSKTPKAINYIPVVSRDDGGGKTTVCNSTDPEVLNEN